MKSEIFLYYMYICTHTSVHTYKKFSHIYTYMYMYKNFHVFALGKSYITDTLITTLRNPPFLKCAV